MLHVNCMQLKVVVARVDRGLVQTLGIESSAITLRLDFKTLKIRFIPGSRMIATSVNYTAQSVALHQLVVKAKKLDPPESVPLIMLLAACLEPFAGFLYVLSSIPAIRQEGFWFMKMEKNGLIRPNIRTLIPMFVLVYIGCDEYGHDSLLPKRSEEVDFVDLHSYPKLDNLPLYALYSKLCYFTTFERGHFTNPARWCFTLSPTRTTIVWNVLILIPRQKAGLAIRQTNGDSTLTYFQPRTVNILSAFFYAYPFVFGGPLIYLITLDLMDIDHRFRDYDHTFSTIMTGKLQPETVLKLNIEAIAQLASMQQRADNVLFFSRLISFGYFLSTLVLLFLMLFGFHRMLQAVRYQIRVFHQAIAPQVPLTLSIISLADNSGPKTMMDSTSPDTSCGDTTIVKRRRKAFKTVVRFPGWLPALRPDPDFLQKPCASSTSDNLSLNASQPWERNNRAIISSQWNALKKYQVNLIWQASCITIVMVTLMGMDVLIFSNYLEVPKRRTLSDLNWFTVCITNATWVWTIGIPFGLVSLNHLSPLREHHPVFVAFSSPITALREKVDVLDEFDY
ncbi:hypothetical protein VP01_3411g2 [Puccinia sorghi]|uniref:Uncharacterized protein n=1 Tax=Puccinia sorghi TaxID=27349 RepID=A0A0L6UWL5_9BASI|nr:hypothetical protein VP01_3411g2 [Puccinia sorghi]